MNFTHEMCFDCYIQHKVCYLADLVRSVYVCAGACCMDVFFLSSFSVCSLSAFFDRFCSLWYFVQDKICRNNKGYNSVNGEKSTEGVLFLEIVIHTLERKILGVFYSAVKHLLYSQA